jgi:HTH-type transcriptional regulator/antitoxin HigA
MARHAAQGAPELDIIAPGETLRDTLEALGMPQRDLADRTGLSTKTVNQIVQGVAPITHHTALKLELATGVPAHMWNNLEAEYREQLARARQYELLAGQADWVDEFPLPELRKLGIVTKTKRDRVGVIEELLSWFGVANRKAWEKVWDVPAAAFRKTAAHESNKVAVATWLRLGELAAARIDCAPYDEDAFRDVIKAARRLTRDDPSTWYERLRPKFAAAGVAFVIIPEIKGCSTYGVTRWLAPDKALIQLSLRGKTEGHFWFTLFHEACHVLRHPKKTTYVQDGSSEDPYESEADQFARRVLVPRRYEGEFEGLQTVKAALSFARKVKVSEAIVLERLRRDHGFSYSRGPQPRMVPCPDLDPD